MMMGKHVGRAAMWAGSQGKRAAADVAAYSTAGKGMGPHLGQGEAGQRIYARGMRNLKWGGAGVGGLAVINASRSPSSGADGMVPHSSGGMTGY